MPSFNRVTLIGNLTRDPEIRYIADGEPVTKFGIAINRRLKGGRSAVDFFEIVAWSKLAELCNTHLKKGACVLVEGVLRNRSYENRDGEKRHVTEIIASRVEFLSSKPRAEEEVMNASAGDEPGDLEDVTL